MKELTQEVLKSILSYDEATGIFRWKIKPSQQTNVGDIAGSVTWWGYTIIGYKHKYYYAQRLAWLYIHGVFPAQEIDHINGTRTDNRISNLRAVSRRSNEQNRVEHRLGKLPGTHFVSGKWQARIRIAGKAKHLGVFSTEQEASEAYFRSVRELEETV